MISLWLLACHMIGDYVVQNDWMAANKLKDWRVRATHVLIYSLCFLPLAFFASPDGRSFNRFMLWLAITHFITDCRRWASGEKWCAKPIMVDQTIHIVTLAILGQLFLT